MKFRQYGRVGGLGLAAVTALALLAACGGSSGSPSAAGSTSSSSPTGNTALTAYVSCLSKNGVTIALPTGRAGTGVRPSGRPSFSGRPSGAPRPSFSPGAGRGNFAGGFPGGGIGGIFANPSTPPSGVDAATWQKALSACKSVLPSFPAGGFGGGRGGANSTALQAYRNCLSSHGVTFSASSGPNALDTADPKVAAALKTCAPLRPTGGANPAPSPSPTS